MNDGEIPKGEGRGRARRGPRQRRAYPARRGSAGQGRWAGALWLVRVADSYGTTGSYLEVSRPPPQPFRAHPRRVHRNGHSGGVRRLAKGCWLDQEARLLPAEDVLPCGEGGIRTLGTV